MVRSWCPWWAEATRRRFLGHVTAVCDARWGGCTVDEEAGTVDVPALNMVLGLRNVAAACRGEPEHQWRLYVYSFASVADDNRPDKVEAKLANIAEVVDELRIRVVTAAHTRGQDVAGYPLPAGLSAALAVDVGGGLAYVTRDRIDKWGSDEQELLDIAAINTVHAVPLEERSPANLARGAPPAIRASMNLAGRWTCFEGRSLFATGHLLAPSPALEGLGYKGAIISMPDASTLLACPVNAGAGAEFLRSAGAMLSAGMVRNAVAPNPISANAIWLRPDGSLEGFAEQQAAGYRVIPSEELKDLVGWPNTTVAPAPDANRAAPRQIDFL